MDVHSQLRTERGTADVLSWVDDLERYPEWMRLIHRVQALEPDERGPAWSVELRARLGPFARSKRLRMVRTVYDAPHRIVFERVEGDGRDHAPWILTLRIDSREGPERSALVTDLDVHLHYGGSLWTGGVLERVLGDEVDRGRDRLLSVLQRH